MTGRIPALCLLLSSTAAAEELVYQGQWLTTNRRLDGTMTCVVTKQGPTEWQGRFYGIWQGVEFDYTVDFTGPGKNLQGTAMIDGASYDWRGWITSKKMKANFSGNRYEGSFELQRVAPLTAIKAAGRPGRTVP